MTTTDLYERFFRDAPDAVVVVGEGGLVVDVFGYPPHELVGRPVEVLVPERLRAAHSGPRRAYHADPTWRPMGDGRELWGRRRDGSEFPADVSLSPAGDDGLVLASIRDVTDRHRAERLARQWAELFDRAAVGVVVSSSDGSVLERMNPAFARMHGYSVDELNGRPLVDVFAPEARGALGAHLAAVAAQGHHTFESVHVRRDGSTFPVEIDATAIVDDGGMQYRVAFVTDITARREAEEARRNSEARFRRVFDGAPIGMALVDEDLRIVRANEALATLIGRDVDSLAGTTLEELTPPEDVRRAERLAVELFAGRLEHFTAETGPRRDVEGAAARGALRSACRRVVSPIAPPTVPSRDSTVLRGSEGTQVTACIQVS
jgi:PAS domain S-box-containing protein